MDAVKFLKKYHKLCDPRSCDDCPLLKRVDGFKTCLAGERNGYEERVVEIVEKWSKEQENKMTKAEAIELLVNATYSEEWQGNEKLTKAQHMAIEALQREPIIYCKDCKHWHEWENGAGSCHRSDIMWVGSDYDDYCSFAERK